MSLYLLSILVIGSIISLTSGYPFRTLLAYDPTRSQLSVDTTTSTKGFLIYLDNSGVERIVGYNYAEPVYAIHQISYINREAPIPSSGEIKAQEAHFRAWSLQQYQVLKREIDLVRGEGREPSAEMLLKFLPLEKIALTSDYTQIAELPEVKRIREEHLNIWQKIPQWDEDKIKGVIRSNSNNPDTFPPAQKLANVQQLNNFNEQLAELKVNKFKQQYAHDGGNKSFIYQSNITKDSDELENVMSDVIFATKISTENETERKEASHRNGTNLNSISQIKTQSEENKSNSTPFKFDNETKQEKIQANIESITTTDPSIEKETLEVTTESEQKQQIFEETTKKEFHEVNLKSPEEQSSVRVQPLQVLETPEVLKAREEHLSLVMKANEKVNGQTKVHSELEKIIAAAPKIHVPQQVVDTAEVMRAREEHLRIVNEAIQKAKLVQAQDHQGIATEPTIVLNGTETEKVALTTKKELDLNI